VLSSLPLSCITHLIWWYSYIWWKYKVLSIACYRGVVDLATICSAVVLHFTVSAKIAAFCSAIAFWIVLMVLKILRMAFYVNVLEGYFMDVFFILFWVLKWFHLLENFQVLTIAHLSRFLPCDCCTNAVQLSAITVWPSGDSLGQPM